MDFSQLKAWVLGASVLALFGCGTVSKPTEHIDPESLKVASKVASIVGDARPGDRVSLPSNSGLGMDSVVVDRTYFSASGRQCRRMRTDDGTPIPRVACKGRDGVWSLARDLRPNTSTAPTIPMTNLVKQADQNNQVLVPSAGSMHLLNEEENLSSYTISQHSTAAIANGATEIPIPTNAQPVLIVPADYTVDENAGTDGTMLPEVSVADTSMLNNAESLILSRAEYAKQVGAEPLEVNTNTNSSPVNAEHLSLGAAKPETEMVTRTVSVNETLWSFAKRTTGNALNWQTIARINGISDAKSLSTGTQLLVPVNLVGQGG